ncbi:MAG: Formate dehydrogenase-like protein cytochrome b subunit [Chlorobi bacterium OLB5]|nr:MAG: Formate dehydrogenase-like protein cytochrome b subunit [Chlorobi bacterium OLB5]
MSGKENLEDIKYLRMSFNERIQHFLLFSSFIVLILTGFGLKFPEAFWVKWIVFIIGENAFEARGIVHRIAAIVMIAASVYHVYYILFVPRGKQLLKDFLPRKQDLLDFKDSILYLIGKSDIKPKLGRFSYIEKMEYWAVVWGTVIMSATGFILWFENTFLKIVGTEGMEVSTVIHYYEAILASLAILVWHFYFIFVNPDVYPMNKAWIKGTLTKEQMEHEHPLELEEILKAELEEINKKNDITENEAELNNEEAASVKEAETDLKKEESAEIEANKPDLNENKN